MSIGKLLNPAHIAVVGASQKRGRGLRVLENLKNYNYQGEIFAVHPEYKEVGGIRCFPRVEALPYPVDCMVVAISADGACDILEQGFQFGIESAVVLAAGFGEGGHGASRVARLNRLGAGGMSVCGPNCYGALNVQTGAAAFSGVLPKKLRPGNVALISQSGGLGANAFMPLMIERHIGFSHFISCGNQIVTHIEDYLAYFIEDQSIEVIAIIVESLKKPRAFFNACLRAHERGKTVIVFQAGQSEIGQQMTRSHTGALATDRDIARAFYRRCGIVLPRNYDEFVETIALLSIVPQQLIPEPEIIIVSGSGGGAAIVADNLAETKLSFVKIDSTTADFLQEVLPDFGSITNPIDATGAMSDNPALLPAMFDILMNVKGQSIIATALSAWPAGKANSLRFAKILADSAGRSDRVIVAYQPSPLGGPIDGEVIDMLHSAGVPLLLGIPSAMRALQHIPRRAERNRAHRHLELSECNEFVVIPPDYIGRANFLSSYGISMVQGRLVTSADDAVQAFHEFGLPVAVKIDSAEILHKSDIGAVRLNCTSNEEVRRAYEDILVNVDRAGFSDAKKMIIQPMHKGLVEAYAAIVHDPVYGSVITCGLGGIFIEILGDVEMEMAPVSQEQAHEMITRLRAAPLLRGARGSPPADIGAFADLLVSLGHIAVKTRSSFRTLELNPVMISAEGKGVLAVDVSIE